MTKKEQFDEIVKGAKKIVVTTHQNPDPDGLCSALGVSVYLEKVFPGKDHEIIINGQAFTEWAWLKQFKKIKWVKEIADELAGTDLLIMTDGNGLHRFSNKPEKIRKLKLITVCIDHHPGEPEDFDLAIIDYGAIAAAQIVAEVLFEDSALLDGKTIKILLTGILSDSGMLMYVGPQTASCFLTMKRLVQAGKIEIQSLVAETDNIGAGELELLQILFANTTNVEMRNRPALTYSFLPKKVAGKYSEEDIGNAYHRFLNMIVRRVKNHPWGFVVAPKPGGKINISLRSLPEGPDVRLIAEKHFYGGGHPRASGGEYRTKEIIGNGEVCRRVVKILNSVRN